nr:MAG TPA: Protein of unknown function (DUF551) [Caudoviricetes sp.]
MDRLNAVLEELHFRFDVGCRTCDDCENLPECAGLDVSAFELLQEYVDRCARYAEETMELREKQQWISVTERLPAEGMRVLAASEGVFSGEAYLSCEGVWMRSYGVVWVSLVDMPVTHWMPLPDAPEVTCDG